MDGKNYAAVIRPASRPSTHASNIWRQLTPIDPGRTIIGMNTSALVLSSLVLIGGCEPAAADPNLLPGGDFSSALQVTGWTSTASAVNVITWSSDDANGDQTSGSLALSVGEMLGVGGSAMAVALSPCFKVTPAASFTFGGQSRSAANGALGIFQCRAFSDSACAQPIAALGFAPLPHSSSWPPSASTSGTLPVEAESAYCSLTITGGGTSQSPITEHFDNLFFNSAAPAVPVRLQEFKVN